MTGCVEVNVAEPACLHAKSRLMEFSPGSRGSCGSGVSTVYTGSGGSKCALRPSASFRACARAQAHRPHCFCSSGFCTALYLRLLAHIEISVLGPYCIILLGWLGPNSHCLFSFPAPFWRSWGLWSVGSNCCRPNKTSSILSNFFFEWVSRKRFLSVPGPYC